jgi:hypothetical protein
MSEKRFLDMPVFPNLGSRTYLLRAIPLHKSARLPKFKASHEYMYPVELQNLADGGMHVSCIDTALICEPTDPGKMKKGIHYHKVVIRRHFGAVAAFADDGAIRAAYAPSNTRQEASNKNPYALLEPFNAWYRCDWWLTPLRGVLYKLRRGNLETGNVSQVVCEIAWPVFRGFDHFQLFPISFPLGACECSPQRKRNRKRYS